MKSVNSVEPEASRKNPVEGGGATTSLHVTQNGSVCLLVGPTSNLFL